MTSDFLRSRRLRVGGIHFLASAFLLICACLFALVWYPPPYLKLSGGTNILFLLAGVDVVLGPALTTLVASPTKPLRELRRDVAIIALLQAAALLYGIHALAEARPVALAFEVDRFRVVSAADIQEEARSKADPAYRQLSWSGPVLVAAVKPTEQSELLKSIELGLAGFDLASVPTNWKPYEAHATEVLQISKPVSQLLSKHPETASRRWAAACDCRYLPLVSRHASWVAIVSAPEGKIIDMMPIDVFSDQ